MDLSESTLENMILTEEEQTLLEKALQEAEVISDKKSAPLDEFFEFGSEAEILDEAVLGKIKGLPSKENREMVLKLKVAQGGVVNRNNRYYPKNLMKREVQALQEKIEKRAVFSNDQHPRRKKGEDGKIEYVDVPNFGSTTFIPYTLEMNESTGEVFSVGVIPKTESGRNYAAIIRAGGRPGVSTRGGGSVKVSKIKLNESTEKEVNIVQDDFHLRTFDTVFDQSLATAGIQAITESQEQNEPNKEDTSETMKTLAEWQKKFPDASKALLEGIQEKNFTLKDLSTVDESIVSVLEESLKPILEAKISEGNEAKIRKQVSELVESQIEKIKDSIKDEELEEAGQVQLAEFFKSLGMDEAISTELKGILEEQGEEAYEVGLRYALFSLLQESLQENEDGDEEGSTPKKKSQQLTESMQEADILRVIEESEVVKGLQKSLDEAQAELGKTKREKAIAECLEKFPYNAKAKEMVRTLLESAKDEKQVQDLYEANIKLLKESGAKEEANPSSKFVPKDGRGGVDEAQEPSVMDESSYEDTLIREAAESFKA